MGDDVGTQLSLVPSRALVIMILEIPFQSCKSLEPREGEPRLPNKDLFPLQNQLEGLGIEPHMFLVGDPKRNRQRALHLRTPALPATPSVCKKSCQRSLLEPGVHNTRYDVCRVSMPSILTAMVGFCVYTAYVRTQCDHVRKQRRQTKKTFSSRSEVCCQSWTLQLASVSLHKFGVQAEHLVRAEPSQEQYYGQQSTQSYQETRMNTHVYMYT